MREEPWFLASVDLVALPTAINVARMFIDAEDVAGHDLAEGIKGLVEAGAVT